MTQPPPRSRKPRFMRASDRPEFTRPADGFVERRRTLKGSLLRYTLLAVLTLIGAWLLLRYRFLTGCAVALLLGLMLHIIGRRTEQLKRILRATEFLSALFASALSKNCYFVMITTLAGEVVYTNRSFQAMFGALCERERFTLREMCESARMDAAMQEALLALLATGMGGSMAVAIRDLSGNSHAMTIEITPIDRPSGFLLIRAL